MSCIVSVSRLVNYLKRLIDDNTNVTNIYVKGEISRVTYHSNGHVYFALKDENSSIDCTLWKSYAQKLTFKLEEGMKVTVFGSPTIYPVRGSLQFNALNVSMDGQGALYIALEKLKNKLLKEGLFNDTHKKPIPKYPSNIAIVSGKTAAGLKDVVTILKRRWPIANIHFYDTLVQGEKASAQIIEALNKADTDNNDIILLVRGGGSIEDLWCFNDEKLAYCIYNLNTCIVTGIGHEIDFTIAEMVSDKRASTPSAAAELITPDINDVKILINNYVNRMESSIQYQLDKNKEVLHRIKNQPIFTSKDYLYKDYRNHLIMNIQSLLNEESNIKKIKLDLYNISHKLANCAVDIQNKNKVSLKKHSDELNYKISLLKEYYKNSLANRIAKLDALSPLKILKRGYSVVKSGDKIISSVNDVDVNEQINIMVSDGQISAQVLTKEENHGK